MTSRTEEQCKLRFMNRDRVRDRIFFFSSASLMSTGFMKTESGCCPLTRAVPIIVVIDRKFESSG